jgi:arginine decarboxylase
VIIPRPDKYFLVAGYGEGLTPLNAFDHALIKAGIGNTNVLRMSSILPPGAREIPPPPLPYGALVPAAYADETSDVPGTTVAAAVACGVPADAALPGVIMEHHLQDSEELCREQVRRKVEEAFAIRGFKLAEVKIASASGVVQRVGSAVAAVVLWT